MKILISSAETNDVRLAGDLGAVGIFTTPSLLAETGPDWRRRLAASADTLDGPIHMHSTEHDTDRILAQFDQFQRLAGERLVAAICISCAGLAAARRLQESLIPTNITAVVTFNQAVIAAQSGADYVSLCFACRDAADALAELTDDLAAYIERHQLETRIIATDIHSPDQFQHAAQCGAHYAAVSAALLSGMVSDPLTDEFLARNEAAWKSIREIR